LKDRSLKDEMRSAVRGDRERAEVRRKAEAEGAAPAPPTKPARDLNRPVTELKRPAAPAAEPEPEAVEPEPEAVEPEPEPQPEPEPRQGFFARLFRR